jgi:hypothetical protein
VESRVRGTAGDWSMYYCGDVAGVVVCGCYRSRHTPAMAKVFLFLRCCMRLLQIQTISRDSRGTYSQKTGYSDFLREIY